MRELILLNVGGMLNMSDLIVVTGPIASGKTTLCEEYEKEGYIYISSDEVSRFVLDSLDYKVRVLFPSAYEDGKLNRQKLSDIVFSDVTKLEMLEIILIPHIYYFTNFIIKIVRKSVVLECTIPPDLDKFDKHPDRVINVKVSREEQMRRLKNRGLSDEKISNILIAQERYFE